MNLKEKSLKINLYLSIQVTEDKIIIKIKKDSAGGIDENIINNIFESILQQNKRQKALGIGLYMSKEIIEKHMKGQ